MRKGNQPRRKNRKTGQKRIKSTRAKIRLTAKKRLVGDPEPQSPKVEM
jgi:hypothetical protein